MRRLGIYLGRIPGFEDKPAFRRLHHATHRNRVGDNHRFSEGHVVVKLVGHRHVIVRGTVRRNDADVGSCDESQHLGLKADEPDNVADTTTRGPSS